MNNRILESGDKLVALLDLAYNRNLTGIRFNEDERRDIANLLAYVRRPEIKLVVHHAS